MRKILFLLAVIFCILSCQLDKDPEEEIPESTPAPTLVGTIGPINTPTLSPLETPTLPPLQTETPSPSPTSDATPTPTPLRIPEYLQTVAIQSIDSESAPYFSFGIGYDSVIDQPLESGNCAFTSNTPTESIGSTEGSLSIHFVETRERLYEALDISASVSINAGLFGASAKFRYAEEIEIKRNCVNAVLRGKIFGKIYELMNPQLNQNASQLSAEEFFDVYGDRYLYKIQTGAEYIGVLQVKFESQSEKQEIEASIKASAFGSSLSTSLKQNLQKYESENRIYVDIKTFGGPPAGSKTLDGLITSINAFLQSTFNNPSSWQTGAMVAYYKNYFDVTGYPPFDATSYRDTYRDILKKYYQNIFIVETFLSDYSSLSSLHRTKRQHLMSDRNALYNAMDAAKYDSLSITTPSLNYPDTPNDVNIILSYNDVGTHIDYYPDDDNPTEITYTMVYRLEGGYIPLTIYDYFNISYRYPYISCETDPWACFSITGEPPLYYMNSYFLTRNGQKVQGFNIDKTILYYADNFFLSGEYEEQTIEEFPF